MPTATMTDVFSLISRDEMEVYGWELKEDEFWFRCTPAAFPFRPQGWKIHVSTSLAAAQDVLDIVVGHLVEEDVAFKFAKSPEQVKALLSHRFDRGGGSKFITVYPRDDEQFRHLVPLLDEATESIDGPAILSDARFSERSLVHYRYGAISGDRQVLRDQGYFDVPLVSPTGDWEEDPRNAWYSPPEWAVAPLERERDEDATSSDIILNGRFRVVEALRHSNRGGVYRAFDQATGEEVVLKEARPFIGPEDDGSDMTDRLRHEYSMLERFRSTPGILPRPVELFEEGGHFFLAESLCAGVDARTWWRENAHLDPERRGALINGLVSQLIDLVEVVHREGIVIRDLTPGNLMIDGDRLSMIDPEFFACENEPVPPAYTFGYAPLSSIRLRGIAPAQSDDHNLGMCIAFLTTGVEPPIVTADTSEELATQVVSDWLALIVQRYPLAARYEATLRSLLEIPTTGAPAATAESREPGVLARKRVREALDDAVSYLVDVDWDDIQHRGATPWRVDDAGATTGDFASVQTGFGGILQVLADLAATPAATPEAEACLRRTAHWMVQALNWRAGRMLPGLYFGRSGTAWALDSAARVLDDVALRASARALILSAPVKWANPDMTHGLAGLGTAHLALSRRTHDPLLERRARLLAERVRDRAEVVDGELTWPIRQTGPDVETDQAHLGFAHGVAGMGLFLLDAAEYFGDEEYLELAAHAARTLAGRAVRRASGAVDWPIGVLDRDEDSRMVRWWCSGSGGIGAFLARYTALTGDAEALELARGAGIACAEEDMALMPGHCHGVSGNAHTLLDLEEFAPSGDFDEAALRSAGVLLNRRIATGSSFVFGNDSGNRTSVSYGQGVTGPISFLTRLLYATPRPFTWNPRR